MGDFQRHQDELCADGFSLGEVAERYGTPTYVYSDAALTRNVEAFMAGLEGMRATVCYAIKANGNLHILRRLHELGCSFDAVSKGELIRLEAAGLPVHEAILSGVGKTSEEIEYALEKDVLYLSVESKEELVQIGDIASARGKQARVSVRVNPDVDAKTHPYISTGMAENKFGVPTSDLMELVELAREHPSLELVGLTCHIGSQITDIAPFEDAAHRLSTLVRDVLEQGVKLKYVGMGGGLGIPYDNETPPNPKDYGAALKRILGPLNLELVLEPGRVLVGNAGLLLTRVVRTKRHGKKTFVLVDAGMNDLLRPALYGAHHRIEAVSSASGREEVEVEVVGPVCESADTFGRNVMLPEPKEGDLLAIHSAGAYGFVMASNYNGRLKPAEVMCRDGKAELIRRRESYSDLYALEQ